VQAADPGDTSNALHAISVLSAGEAWAVGASGEVTSPNLVLLERWDGEAWTAEEGPSPGSETNELLDVDASEPNDVWAVGRTSSGFGDRPLVLHNDGSTWTVDDLPPDVSGVLTGVIVDYDSEPYGYFSVEPKEFAVQFTNKSIRDPFRVGGDVDAVSRASLSINSAARAIRDSSRMMARALLTPDAVKR